MCVGWDTYGRASEAYMLHILACNSTLLILIQFYVLSTPHSLYEEERGEASSGLARRVHLCYSPLERDYVDCGRSDMLAWGEDSELPLGSLSLERELPTRMLVHTRALWIDVTYVRYCSSRRTSGRGTTT